MPIIRENEFASLSNREYWVTSNGSRMFPHEFEDEHLVNTLKLLQRKAKEYRLEQARDMCEAVHKTGHGNLEPSEYHRYFRREMDMFLDTSLTNEDWLKDKSKIFCLLVEEAKYRKLDYNLVEAPNNTDEYTYRTTLRTTATRPTYTYTFHNNSN